MVAPVFQLERGGVFFDNICPFLHLPDMLKNNVVQRYDHFLDRKRDGPSGAPISLNNLKDVVCKRHNATFFSAHAFACQTCPSSCFHFLVKLCPRFTHCFPRQNVSRAQFSPLPCVNFPRAGLGGGAWSGVFLLLHGPRASPLYYSVLYTEYVCTALLIYARALWTAVQYCSMQNLPT